MELNPKKIFVQLKKNKWVLQTPLNANAGYAIVQKLLGYVWLYELAPAVIIYKGFELLQCSWWNNSFQALGKFWVFQEWNSSFQLELVP